MKTILVVDDEEEICSSLEDVFNEEGFIVYTARNSKEALNILQKIVPDLILLDIVLPEVNGIELCKKIKKNLSFENVPVILMTSFDNEERKVDSYIAGANNYITKPFEIDDLVLKIRNELEPPAIELN